MSDLQSQQKQEMTPIFASERLDWANAIGLFIVNFGMLDWQVFVFLESRVNPELFAKLKSKHFKDRIVLSTPW